MKKPYIILICFIFTLTLKGQITINFNGTLKDLFSLLQKDYDYKFMYNNEEVDDTQMVSLNVQNANINTVLNELSNRINVSYEIKKKYIIIKYSVQKKNIDLNRKEELKGNIISDNIRKKPEIPVKINDPVIKIENKVETLTDVKENKIIDQLKKNEITDSIPKAIEEKEEEKSGKTEEIEIKTSKKIDTEEINESYKSSLNSNLLNFYLHTNLLYDLILTPNLGIELTIKENWGMILNGSWTHINWANQSKAYRLWSASSELRYYLLHSKKLYAGGIIQFGSLNYKFGETGNQGDFISGGITAGYILELNRSFKLDFGIGFGYNHFDYDEYEYREGVNLRTGSNTKKIWFPLKAGATLIWQLK